MPDRNPDDYYAIRPYGKYFAVYQLGERLLEEEDDQPDTLICICVYKKGAEEVRRRLLGPRPKDAREMANIPMVLHDQEGASYSTT
jgi:hypothetical protein